ncbi:MAG: ABA4-like family protein, partial [Chloroflexota bacterium]
MELDTIFSLSNLVIMPFWLLMIVLPFWSWSERIMQAYWPIALPSIFYVYFLLFGGGGSPELMAELMNPTIEGISSLLSNPAGAAVGWAHFLAFDLFVGRWVFLEARKSGTPWWVSSPILFFTLMLGPVGFLLWFIVRRFRPGLDS